MHVALNSMSCTHSACIGLFQMLLKSMINNKASIPIAFVLATFGFWNSPAFAHGKGLYSTQAEAQARAEELGCTTSHQNNDRWMPCANEQELHRQLRKQ